MLLCLLLNIFLPAKSNNYLPGLSRIENHAQQLSGSETVEDGEPGIRTTIQLYVIFEQSHFSLV